MKYRGPHLAMDFLRANICGDNQEKKVLDVACGSGLVAKLMYDLGFRHFVGVDGSQCMLDQAAKIGLYQELKLALLGHQPLPANTDEFDVVIIIGSLRENLVPVTVIRELCNAAKPGGYICMSTRNPKTKSGGEYNASMERELQLMEEEGLWVREASEEMKKYMINIYDENSGKEENSDNYLPGTLYLYRKTKVD
ncbi:methyltransferase-like protein 27 [Pholidichthys leucotaenia]